MISGNAPRQSGERPTPLLVYVHFPWCLEKCPYCDFVSFKTARDVVPHDAYADAVIAELDARVDELARTVEQPELVSVFFGGGTPSLWEPSALGRVVAAIRRRIPAHGDVEITAECNPNSLDEDRARALVDAGVNRVSIGVQALDDARLRFLGRLHDARGALAALEGAVRAKVPRVSGDLIYGVHGMTADIAAAEARRIVETGLTHLSAYNLTIEQRTKFGELARKGRLPIADEGEMVASFFAIDEALAARGLAHYEISNYAVPGDESRHNLGYWRGHAYLGLGCAAVGALPHRDAVIRWRNAIFPEKYVRAAATTRREDLYEPGALVESIETLDPETRLRERIMLGLRLAGGLDLAEAAAEVGATAWTRERERAVEKMVGRKRLVREGDVLRVPRDAWILADGTAAELF